MALNDVIFTKNTNGLGRPLPGTDYISGFLFYSDATLPSGFTSSSRVKPIFSVSDAVTLGITNTSLGETKSTATYLVTTKFGATTDRFKLTCATIASASPIVADALAGVITLCDYQPDTAAIASINASASAIATAINALTYLHGFTAVANTATVTITAPAGQGIFLNSGTPYVKTETGAIVGTLTQNVVAGVASDIDILYYHISEFFRMQPKGKLWVGIYATSDVGTFNSVTLLQNAASGEINQMGIYAKSAAFSTAHLNAIQSQITALEALHKPLVAIYGPEITGTADLTSFTTNLKALSDPQVSVTFGQDGAAKGFKIFKATGKSITNVGEILGAVALAKVSESIAWLGKFQVSTTELDTVAFANGQLFSSLSDGAITNLDTLGVCFLRKVPDLSGTFHNRPWTAVLPTNDFNEIHPNRTIYKAIKNTRTVLLPETGSPIFVNADGTLTEDVIGYFKGLVKQGLDSMVRDKELSNFNPIIDPSQNVLSTGILYVTIELQPVGTANTIVVNIGFTDVLTTTA